MQLDPPIKVMTPLGDGFAYFLEDGPKGVEWQVFIRKTGESWWWTNPYIRLSTDITTGVENSAFLDIPAGLDKHIARYKENGWL